MLATDALNRPLRAVMEPNVFWLPLDMPLPRAAQALAEQQFSGAPVCAPATGSAMGALFEPGCSAAHYIHLGVPPTCVGT